MDQEQSINIQVEISRLVAELSRLVAETTQLVAATARAEKEPDPAIAELMAETAKLNNGVRWYEVVIITGCVVALMTFTKLFL